MKLKFVFMMALAGAAGWGAWHLSQRVSGMTIEHSSGAKPAGASYQCPMHPWVASDREGLCTVCGMNLAPKSRSAKSIVMLPESSPNVMGVETVTVEKRPLIRTLRVAGMIGEDESRHSIISAPVEGRIDGLAMSCEGDNIHERQPLANLFSRTLLAEAEEYKRALKTGGPELEAAKRRLLQDGLVWEQINAIPARQPDDIYFGILSRLTGSVVKSYVSEGQYVQEGDRLFEVADFTKMWFIFAVYEQDLPFVHAGQWVTITTPSLPGETLRAKVSFVNPNLDGLTRTAQVRVVLENHDRRIKNNTFAEAILQLDAPEVLAVPRRAVLWPGTQPRLYVQQSSGAYQQRKVKLGLTGDSDVEVLDGLKEGERVVLQGNMLMDSQAQLDQDAGTCPTEKMP